MSGINEYRTMVRPPRLTFDIISGPSGDELRTRISMESSFIGEIPMKYSLVIGILLKKDLKQR